MVDEPRQTATKEQAQKSVEEEEEVVKLKKKPTWLFIVIGIVAVVAVAVAVYAITKSGKSAKSHGKKASAKAGESESVGAPEEMGPTFNLGTFIFNLADSEERRYLKATIEIELISPELVPEAEKRLPKIKDSMILLVSSRTASELSTPEGQMLLRQQIAKRLGEIMGEGTVKDVYLTEFLIQ